MIILQNHIEVHHSTILLSGLSISKLRCRKTVPVEWFAITLSLRPYLIVFYLSLSHSILSPPLQHGILSLHLSQTLLTNAMSSLYCATWQHMGGQAITFTFLHLKHGLQGNSLNSSQHPVLNRPQTSEPHTKIRFQYCTKIIHISTSSCLRYKIEKGLSEGDQGRPKPNFSNDFELKPEAALQCNITLTNPF